MNRHLSAILPVAVVSALLFACAEVTEYVVGEETIKPTELTIFKQTLPVKLAWSTQLNAITGR